MTEKPGSETGAQDDNAPNEQPIESVVEEITVSPVRALLRARRLEIILGIGLCLYSILAVLAHVYAYFSWDLRLARLIQSVDVPGFDTLMICTSMPGNKWAPWILTITISTLLALLRLKLEGVICLISAGAGALLDRVMKIVIARPRPDQDIVQVMGDFKHESFPSGHVFFYVSFFGLLFFLTYVLLKRIPLRRILLVILALPLLLIGISRVYLGAHWPSDVIGAYLAGGVWLIIIIELYRRLKAQQS